MRRTLEGKKVLVTAAGQGIRRTSAEAVKALVASSPSVDVLVNCAGSVHNGTILDYGDTHWDRSFDLNAKAMFQMMKAVLPAMVQKRSGSIVNISSIVFSLKGALRRFAYGLGKRRSAA